MQEPIHILLADDDEDDRFLFADACKEISLKTVLHVVHDGFQLMEYLRLTTNELPHIIFLDINMPFKSGLECLEEIKSNERLKDIPIAILSSSVYEENIERAFHFDAHIYIQKPYSFSEIRETIQAVISIDWEAHPSRLYRSRDTFRFAL